jgi:hypothetical protein
LRKGKTNVPSENAAKPDVVVRVRRRIVQIQSEQAGIRRVVPIAATFERLKSHPLLNFCSGPAATN